MRYLKKFENYSTDFYSKFRKSDFPKKIKFDNPKCVYEMRDFIPGMNKVTIYYNLIDKKDQNNPYEGTIPDIMQMDISVIYNMEKTKKTKMFLRILCGSQVWYEISYSDSKIYKDDSPNYKKINKSTLVIIKNILKKYSKL